MSVGLGMPAPPVPTLAPRRKTRQLMVGDVGVGSDHPIAVQSMTTTKTHDVNATLQQIAELTATGCDIVRVACPRQEDADALAEIARHSQLPVIADIHFQPQATSSPRSTPGALRFALIRAISRSLTAGSARSPRPPAPRASRSASA